MEVHGLRKETVMRRAHDPLFDEGRKRHPVLGFFLLLLILIIATLTVLNSINNSRVDLLRQSVTVANLPSTLENFRILHISDLHGLYFGPHQEQIKAAISSARYDIVCITGDVTGRDGDAGAFLELIRLFGDTPVYFIPGDEDPPPLSAQPTGNGTAKADYILAAEGLGAVYLDAPVKIARGKGVLWMSPEWIYTLDYDTSEAAYQSRLAELRAAAPSPERDAALAAVEYQMEQLNRIREARRETLDSDIHIALTHHPLQDSALQSLRNWTSADNDSHIRALALVLAGHNVAGQWRLPAIGALRAPADADLGALWFPQDDKIVGLSTTYGISQYISPGLGTSSAIPLPPIRLFNTPAVTLITLTSKLTY